MIWSSMNLRSGGTGSMEPMNRYLISFVNDLKVASEEMSYYSSSLTLSDWRIGLSN
jgi:hypothetical protein